MLTCETCGKADIKSEAGLAAHNRLKHAPAVEEALDITEIAEAPPSFVVPEPTGEPGSWKGHRASRMQPCSREIKMLRPVCRTCEEEAGGKKYLASTWFEVCPHDPYISYVERTIPQPIMEPMDASNPNGPKRIVRVEQMVVMEPKPNWTSTTVGGGVNKGRGIHKALWKGFIYPQQLRSPLFPNGLKRRCQFRDCLAEDVKRYRNGWFCREEEAKLVYISDSEETWQVDFGDTSKGLQKKQLDAVNVRE